MRRSWVCCWVLAGLVCGIGAAVAAEPPNLIVILADDMGYGDISPYGGWIETPQLQRLADGGTRFTDFHSSGNVCSPTRAGLLTGRYQQRAGIPGVVFADPAHPVHKHGLQPSERTLPELLHAAGYRTAMFGKWHLGYERRYNPVHHGFDEFRGYVSGNIDFHSHVDQAGNYDWWHNTEQAQEPGYVTHLIDAHALRFIRDNRDRPFFLYLAHEAPHYPFQRPEDPADRKVGEGIANDWHRQRSITKPEIRERYQVMVEELDRNVGNVLDLLSELQLDRRTLIVFFSDNGAAGAFGDNTPLRGAKGSNWEGGHRVPAIMSWPGQIPAGKVTDELAISLDVMPTLLSAAHVSVPESLQLDGANLLPVLTEGQSLGERRLVWNGKALREGPWKLMVGADGQQEPALYHLGDDLQERHNIAADHPERVQRMQDELARWREDIAATATPQPE